MAEAVQAAAVQSARELCLTSEILLGGVAINLPRSLVYSNLAEFYPAFADGHFDAAFGARRPQPFNVELCRLRPNTVLYGGGDFLMSSGGIEIQEQVPPALMTAHEQRQAILCTQRPIREIAAPCIIVARYGEGTWGHWLGELLPRAALAEYFRPGIFSYILPEWMSRRGSAGGLGTAVLDSLAAFGIGEDRLIRVAPDLNFHFANAHILTPIWHDHIPHPAALDLMRAVPPISETVLLPRKLAVLRYSPARNLENIPAISTVLARHGYTSVHVGMLPFDQQIAMFRHATHVFATLGSDLTGLMFSPNGVRVLAAAPEDWTDRFFYGLVQLRGGTYSELRGPVVHRNDTLPRNSSFAIEPRRLDELLARLEG